MTNPSSPGIDASLPAPDYGDPTGETAIRNILSGADWSGHADWKILGPLRAAGQITVSLSPEAAESVFRHLSAVAEGKASRTGKSYRIRLRKDSSNGTS